MKLVDDAFSYCLVEKRKKKSILQAYMDEEKLRGNIFYAFGVLLAVAYFSISSLKKWESFFT